MKEKNGKTMISNCWVIDRVGTWIQSGFWGGTSHRRLGLAYMRDDKRYQLALGNIVRALGLLSFLISPRLGHLT